MPQVAKRRALILLWLLAMAGLPWLLRRWLPWVAGVLPVTINLALAAMFARTLRKANEPMIARFARAERGGELEPDLKKYTRMLTRIWVLFFVACAAIGGWLWLQGAGAAWLLFTSVGSYVAAGALFIGEYLFRRRRFAHYTHASPQVMWAHVSRVLRNRGAR